MFTNRALDTFLARVRSDWGASDAQMHQLRDAVGTILDRTRLVLGPQRDENIRSQLVVGEVQSGKTAAIQAVTAGLRDLGMPVVVVLGGTKVTLVKQTASRFRSELCGTDATSDIQWNVIEDSLTVLTGRSSNTSKQKRARLHEQVCDGVLAFRDAHRHEAQKVCSIIVATKTKGAVENVGKFLDSVRVAVGEFPVVVIDDEADQATQNIAREFEGRSAVYAAISDLLQRFVCADFVMFTATPYATLYQDALRDVLAPEFAYVLKPGPGYFGLDQMVDEYRAQRGESRDFIQLVDEDEYAESKASGVIPGSLLKALAYFLLVFVAKRIAAERLSPVSMLVHPSGLQIDQRQVADWLIEIRSQWLNSGFGSHWFRQFAEPLLGEAGNSALHEALKMLGSQSGRSVQEVVQHELSGLFEKKVKFAVVNSDSELQRLLRRNEVPGLEKPESSIDWPAYWNSQAGWVLIGGNAIERGFTLKNLVVTYMPRVASSQADVNQQRGRFFGYRRGYLELSRAWIPYSTMQQFEKVRRLDGYVREVLEELAHNEESLDELDRVFLTSPGLKLTRANIQGLTESRIRLGKWFLKQSRLEAISAVEASQALSEGLAVLEKFGAAWEPRPSDKREGVLPTHRHHHALVPLEGLHAFLDGWPALVRGEEKVFRALRAYLWRAALSGPVSHARVILMDNLKADLERDDGVRRRTPRANGGASPEMRQYQLHGAGKGQFADNEQYDANAITVQIHRVHCQFPGAPQDISERLRVGIALSWPQTVEQSELVHLFSEDGVYPSFAS